MTELKGRSAITIRAVRFPCKQSFDQVVSQPSQAVQIYQDRLVLPVKAMTVIRIEFTDRIVWMLQLADRLSQ